MKLKSQDYLPENIEIRTYTFKISNWPIKKVFFKNLILMISSFLISSTQCCSNKKPNKKRFEHLQFWLWICTYQAFKHRYSNHNQTFNKSYNQNHYVHEKSKCRCKVLKQRTLKKNCVIIYLMLIVCKCTFLEGRLFKNEFCGGVF